jgi:hypothetical protein
VTELECGYNQGREKSSCSSLPWKSREILCGGFLPKQLPNKGNCYPLGSFRFCEREGERRELVGFTLACPVQAWLSNGFIWLGFFCFACFKTHFRVGF